MASTYLTRTPSSAGNTNIWTWSAWIKRSGISSTQFLMGSSTSASDFEDIRIDSEDQINYVRYLTTKQWGYNTANRLRDTSGWYHLCINRSGTTMKCFINGVLATKENETTSTATGDFNTTDELRIGGRPDSSHTFDGLMSHVYFIDGTAYDADTFGETDATTGEWKINTAPSVTYGTNGFLILKDGNTITDQSSNSNNFTLGAGTLTNTEDCPSDVFATLNPLQTPTSNTPTYSNGNTTSITSTTSGAYRWGGATTLGMTKGKFYCEAKATVDGTYSRNVLGVTGDASELARGNSSVYGANYSSGWYSDDGGVKLNGSAAYTASTYTTGDILSIAIDLDNLKLYYAKGGTWQNSGVPTSGATGTGALTLTAVASTPDGAYFFCQTDDTGTTSPSKFEFNFGNGYFGTTAISSEGTNASSIGKFEYDVPTGYTALSTKGLNA